MILIARRGQSIQTLQSMLTTKFIDLKLYSQSITQSPNSRSLILFVYHSFNSIKLIQNNFLINYNHFKLYSIAVSKLPKMQEENQSKFLQNYPFIHKPSPTELTIKLNKLLDRNDTKTSFQCLLILDNQIHPHLLQILQPKSQNIVLVDGGSNRFYQTNFRNSPKIRCVIGDLDGLKDEPKHYYQKKGVDVIHDPDQNTTDFEKALKYCRKMDYTQMVFLNFYPGRIDHILAAMSATQRHLEQHKQDNILLLGKNSLMIYIHPKLDYTIEVKSQWIDTKGCGLITFGRVNFIETKGFKWNLGEEEFYKYLEWGKFLSTSNEFIEDRVQVSANDPIFLVGQIKTENGTEGNW